MQRLTVFSIEREADNNIMYDKSRKYWNIAYRKDSGGGGLAWAHGEDELSAFVNFRNMKLNSEESIKDRFEVILGTEQ